MAALIDMSKGLPAIAYAGETPWHGLGQKTPHNAPLSVWQKNAGLDWEVLKIQASFKSPKSGNLADIADRVALVRSDTESALGVVSDSRFKPFQPGELLGFYRNLVKDHGWTIETAGALKGGRRIWALANVGVTYKKLKGDEIGQYLLLATGMDGTMATVIRRTAICVVCNNTLTAALPAADRGVTDIDRGIITVSHRSTVDVERIQDDLGLIPQQAKDFGEVVHALASKPISEKKAVDFFIALLLGAGKHDDSEVLGEENKLRKLLASYRNGPGQTLASRKDTLWGAVNAVSFYTDHMVGRANDTALNKAWFGANETLKNSALRLAMRQADLIAA